MTDRNKGFLLVVLSAIFYSSLGILGKYIYTTGIEMSLVVLLRFLATVVLLGLFWLIRRKEPLLTLSPVVLFQGLFFVASAVVYFMAVKHLSAGLATVILFAHPALVAVLAVIFYREKISGRHVTGLVLALLGLLFISGVLNQGGSELSPLGLVLATLSAVVYGIYALLGQKSIKKDGVWTISFTAALMGLVIVAAVFPSNIPSLLSVTPYQASLAVAMAFFGTILPVVLFLEGVKKIGASMASLISITEIPFSLVLAFVVLGEVVTTMQIVGTLLIVLATIVAMTVRKK